MEEIKRGRKLKERNVKTNPKEDEVFDVKKETVEETTPIKNQGRKLKSRKKTDEKDTVNNKQNVLSKKEKSTRKLKPKKATAEEEFLINEEIAKPVSEKITAPKDYIDQILDLKLQEIDKKENVYGTGKVVKVKDFIVEVVGLENAKFYEKININNKAIGYVMNLGGNNASIALLNVDEKIHVGDIAYQTNEIYTGVFSNDSFGRVIDIFGNDKLTNKKFRTTMNLPIESEVPSITDRSKVSRPFYTGITGIDFIYPIGKGQRQLIIGDKKTGKTQICLDTIVNQKDKNVICLYIAIGKTKKEVKELYYELLKRNAMSYTIILSAFYDDLPPVIALTPHFGLSIANHYMMLGYDVLVVIDDLKKHADAYREISLISNKNPGRDAYPSDIFYFHSRMLEKGCQYKNGASITILPVVETKGEDITDYISTNIISITDGQIVLSRKNFTKGEKPAINYGLSVSRLGGAVQEQEVKALSAKVKSDLLSYLETRSVYELANEDEIPKDIREKITTGKQILEKLKQYKFSPIKIEDMITKFSVEEKQDG